MWACVYLFRFIPLLWHIDQFSWAPSSSSCDWMLSGSFRVFPNGTHQNRNPGTDKTPDILFWSIRLYGGGYHTAEGAAEGSESPRLHSQSPGNEPERAAVIEAFRLISSVAAKLRVASSVTSLGLQGALKQSLSILVPVKRKLLGHVGVKLPTLAAGERQDGWTRSEHWSLATQHSC